MAETSSQDRTLPATPKKLKKARDDGQVVRSREWGHFVAIAAGGALLLTFAPALVDWLKQTLVQGLRFDAAMLREPGLMGARLSEMTARMLWVVLPMGGAMAATGVAAT